MMKMFNEKDSYEMNWKRKKLLELAMSSFIFVGRMDLFKSPEK